MARTPVDHASLPVGSSGHSSLSDQLSTDAHGRALRLELENQRLLALVETLRETSARQTSESILELEKENKRLSLKVSGRGEREGGEARDPATLFYLWPTVQPSL